MPTLPLREGEILGAKLLSTKTIALQAHRQRQRRVYFNLYEIRIVRII